MTSSLGGGGVAQLLVNYFNHIDPSQITSDFIVHGQKIGVHEQYFTDKGGRVFHAPPKKINPLRNVLYIFRIIANGNYDVVHAHQNFSNVVPLVIAKLLKIPVRISHGHGYQNTSSIFAFFARYGIQRAATDLFACNESVGSWLHRKKWNNPKSQTFVMKNAIDLDQFSFDPAGRENWRNELNLDDSPTLIQIGRLSEEKNCKFSISLLKQLRKTGNWKLIVVGDGHLESSLKSMVDHLGLSDSVYFIGYQKDVPGLLSASDICLIPSISEGLSIAAVEAQAAKIAVLGSNALPDDVAVSKYIERLPLDLDMWVEKITGTNPNYDRQSTDLDPRLKGFEIKVAAPKYIDYVRKALAENTLSR